MYQHYIKPVLDYIAAFLALPVFLVILIIVAPLIYFEDKGTIFYSSERLGKNGKKFKMYKLRTMKMNSIDIRNKDRSTFNSKNDQRVTKIGKVLRKLSIDETPQILNILKHQMSLIGPRPDLPEHIHYYNETEKKKLQVLPGITGYNQAYFRNCAEWKVRLTNDVHYVEHLCFWLDMKVFFKTIACIILRKGIYMTCQDSYDERNGENYKCFRLTWDTEYFQVPSSRINLYGAVNKEAQLKIKEFANHFDFTTIYNFDNNKENNNWIGNETKAFLADMNIQFIKKLSNEPKEPKELEDLEGQEEAKALEDSEKLEESDDKTEVFHSYIRNQRILSIAREAFEHSRFFNDSRLPEEQALQIYQQWTEHAFEKEEKYFVIAKDKEEITGFILFSMNVEYTAATIELIAVDKYFRGRGVGKALIKTMESYVMKKGIFQIKVGTQINNTSAIQFYSALGFQYNNCNAVYHLWRAPRSKRSKGA